MATDEYTAPTPEGAGRAVEELLGHEVVRVELPRRRRGLSISPPGAVAVVLVVDEHGAALRGGVAADRGPA